MLGRIISVPSGFANNDEWTIIRRGETVQTFIASWEKLSTGTTQKQKVLGNTKEDAERIASRLAAMRGWKFLSVEEEPAAAPAPAPEPVAATTTGAEYNKAEESLTCKACGKKNPLEKYICEEATLKCPGCGLEIELKGVVKDKAVANAEGEGGDKVPAPEERIPEPEKPTATTEINEPSVDMGAETGK